MKLRDLAILVVGIVVGSLLPSARAQEIARLTTEGALRVGLPSIDLATVDRLSITSNVPLRQVIFPASSMPQQQPADPPCERTPFTACLSSAFRLTNTDPLSANKVIFVGKAEDWYTFNICRRAFDASGSEQCTTLAAVWRDQ